MNIRFVLAYAGTRYFGFQKTKMGPSIEEEVEKKLSQILQQPITLQAASRTDRGVHAEGQVVNFSLEKQVDVDKLFDSLRKMLPRDIALIEMEEMHDAFHPTTDAKGKEYHYFLCNEKHQLPFHREFSWHIHQPLELFLMQKGAVHLEGRRDYSSLTNIRVEDGVRNIQTIAIEPLPANRILFRIIGDRFLYKMVRNIVGTLVYVAMGKIAVNDLPSILESRHRPRAGITAPAHGLCLKKVFY